MADRVKAVAFANIADVQSSADSRRIAIDPYRAHAHAWQFAPDFGNLIEREGWTVTETIAADAYPAAELQRYGIDPAERYLQARKEG